MSSGSGTPGTQPHSLKLEHVRDQCVPSGYQSWIGKCPDHCSADSGVCTVSSVSGTRKTCSCWGPTHLFGAACCMGPGAPKWQLPGCRASANVTTLLGLSFLICQARRVIPPCKKLRGCSGDKRGSRNPGPWFLQRKEAETKERSSEVGERSSALRSLHR